MEKPEAPSQGDFIGYARVSTDEQILDLQITALNNAGCINVYKETVSASGKQKRPQLDLAIKELRQGDTLVVWRLDRLARSQEEFYRRIKEIHDNGARFRSLTEGFTFDDFMGRFVLGILALCAELERQITIHRTKAGLEEARRRGQKLGAERKINDAMMRRIKKKAKLKGAKRMTLQAIADSENIALSSIFGRFEGGRAKIIAWKAK